MKQAVMLFAEGFEEVEALMTADILMRGGVDLKLVSITEAIQVTGSHGITVSMDRNLGASDRVTKALKQMNEAGKIVAAICAAPSVLGACGILEGKKATCYPGFEDQLTGAEFVDEMAVVDGNVVTSRGLGTSMEFGFALLQQLVSREKAEEIRQQIVFKYHHVS